MSIDIAASFLCISIGYDMPETVLLQVYCEGRVLAQSEFTYYANTQFNSDQLFHYLVQNMPHYFQVDDISGEKHQCKLTPSITNMRYSGRGSVYMDTCMGCCAFESHLRQQFLCKCLSIVLYVPLMMHVCTGVQVFLFLHTFCDCLSVPTHSVQCKCIWIVQPQLLTFTILFSSTFLLQCRCTWLP